MSRSMTGLTLSKDSAGTSSCSFDSSLRYGSGKMSALDDSHCPNFM